VFLPACLCSYLSVWYACLASCLLAFLLFVHPVCSFVVTCVLFPLSSSIFFSCFI
jgi:hypothetical protein